MMSDLDVDWKLCVLCQTETTEKLTAACSQGAGYELIAKNLLEFHKLHSLPVTLKAGLIASINQLKPLLIKHAACWHKTCYLKINNTKLDRARLKEKKSEEESNITNPMTRSSVPTAYNNNTCLFCGLQSIRRNLLCSVMKKSCSDSIIACATELNDYELLAKVSKTCDLISLEAKYHNKCYINYKNRLKPIQNTIKHQSKLKRQVQAITFSEIITYMNDLRENEDEIPVFNVVELASKQSQTMKELGVDHVVHSYKLKEKLLKECPDLIAITRAGLPNLVTFKTKSSSSGRDFESEGAALSEVVKIVRSDIFENEDEYSKAPPSLMALIKMLIFGPNSTGDYDVPCHTISDLIVYHAIQSRKRGLKRRHNKTQETSGPVYLAAKLYAATRKKKLIECAHQLGVSISYPRLQSIITEEANKVCSVYQKEQVVAPLKLQKGLFTTAAVDNVDHNPTSTSAETSFHGTAITLMQHKMPNESGFPRLITQQIPEDDVSSERKIIELPLEYSVVPPCFLDLKKFTCTKTDVYTHEVSDTSLPLTEEQEWLQQTMSDTFKPWAAYHATVDRDPNERHSTDVALLPIFKEQSHNAAMMLHSMKMVKKAVEFLNPGQIPVLVADQPLYALLKQIQYLLPETVGEDKMLVFMGGLHIEMAGLKTVGQWLRGSGWVEALIQANITSSGRAEATLTAAHVTRTRYAHQVTATALYILQKKAYVTMTESQKSNISFEEWRLEMLNSIPQFKYWDIVLQMELLILQLVRSIRIGDFGTYMNSLRRLVPWFFALDHNNYARWLSIHIRDLANLKESHPDIQKRFEAGQFVARRSNKPFSAMALDQAHEQMNALIKGDGGMIGLTEKPDSLRKWLIAGPEIAAMVEAFESDILQICNDADTDQSIDNRHHSDTVAYQNKFVKMVKSLEKTINDMSNPFLEETQDLYNIDSKKMSGEDFINTLFNIEKNGEQQYIQFCKERLQGDTSLQEPMKLNKYTLFSTCVNKTSKTKAKIAGLKNDCSLFSKLYIATSERRRGDLDVFFAHENQPYPPALSTSGSLRSCTKSDLLKCLTNSCVKSTAQAAPPVTAKVLDGPAIVHMLNPGQSSTFGDYANNIFKPFVQKELTNAQRVDIIWDRYDENSIKNSTREKRGIGSRTRVCPNTRIPKGWINFLRDNENKKELFHMLSLACHSMEVSDEKELNITDGMTVLSSSDRCKNNIDPCNHEEADTRIMVHVADAVANGYKRIMIRTVDTDVVVLAVSCVSKLQDKIELWVHIGTGKNHQFLSCDKIAAYLGPERARALPVFHALTGCDTVSAFSGRGKKTAFEAWNTFPSVTNAFNMLADGEVEIPNQLIQKFIITMYDKSSQCTSLNACRRELFSKKDRQLENIPPTEASFRQHLLRAVYQGVHVWGQAMVPIQNLPSPADWGWEMESNNWRPKWTTEPVAATACRELIRCKCKSQCGVRCNCIKKQLKCTELCHCGGNCN